MRKIAIYPGTFDPITYGHIDVIQKALKIFDNIVVAISDSKQKNQLFSIDERIDIVNRALFFDLKLSYNKYLKQFFSTIIKLPTITNIKIVENFIKIANN